LKNWLITGGCGFIGTSLVQKLLADGQDINIRIFDNLSVGSRGDLGEVADFKETGIDSLDGFSGVQLVVGDIRDSEACLKAVKGADVIVHLAANTGVGPSVSDPRTDMEANVFGIFNMLESARVSGVDKFIFASSGAPIGELENPPIHEELPAHPISPYGASKLAGEGYCSAYFGSYGLKTVVLRFGNVYGPRSKNKASVVAKFIKQALNGETCEIFGDGTQTRDFIYIGDLVRAVIKAAESDAGGEIFQIATSRECTVNELAELIKTELAEFGKKMEIVHGEYRPGDVARNFSDTSKAERMLGWKNEISINEGINRTVKYFLGHK